MKLKLLREHYQSNDKITWTPKRAFTSPEQIQEELGFDPALCNIYTCSICNLLHTSTYPLSGRST